jgi:sulfotransferase family protein
MVEDGMPAFDCRTDRKPNLFLIGAMKSGTSYLGKLLASHPAIFMSQPDEPSYFVEPRQLKAIWPEMWERGFWRDEERYLRLFQSAGRATFIGEASTNYTKLPSVTGVSQRIRAFNPDARLIYLMRDPVERTLSHYWHMVRYHTEHRPIAAAIRRNSQFVAVSYYAMQLRPFLERFGRDRVAILTHEKLVGDPIGTMQSLYRWLGIEPTAADVSGFAEAENVTPEVIRTPLWGALARRVGQLAPVRHIMSYIPQPMQATLRKIANRDVRRQSVNVMEVIRFLQPIQRRQTDELMQLLGRDFPEWSTLNEDLASSSRSQEVHA